jgi:hypothetical protein
MLVARVLMARERSGSAEEQESQGDGEEVGREPGDK